MMMVIVLGMAGHGYAFSTTSPHFSKKNSSVNGQAIILSYLKINEDYEPESSIRESRFIKHIREILDHGYKVARVQDIVFALRNEDVLHERTVGITFDTGYTSAHRSAMQLLLDMDIPFTVFIAPEKISRSRGYTITWNDIEKLKSSGLVDFGIIGEHSDNIEASINSARSVFREKIGYEPALFAYPNGVHSFTQDIIANSIFAGAFDQHPGVAHHGSDILSLPRNMMTDANGEIDRFQKLLKSYPMHVSDVSGSGISSDNPPAFGFTFHHFTDGDLEHLSCSTATNRTGKIDVIGRNRIEVRFDETFDNLAGHLQCMIGRFEQAQTDKPSYWEVLGIPYVIQGTPN